MHQIRWTFYTRVKSNQCSNEITHDSKLFKKKNQFETLLPLFIMLFFFFLSFNLLYLGGFLIALGQGLFSLHLYSNSHALRFLISMI